MNKPRCLNCTRSMKRLYHRKGGKGVHTVVNDWWYCPSCHSINHKLVQKKDEIKINLTSTDEPIDYRDIRIRINENTIDLNDKINYYGTEDSFLNYEPKEIK